MDDSPGRREDALILIGNHRGSTFTPTQKVLIIKVAEVKILKKSVIPNRNKE